VWVIAIHFNQSTRIDQSIQPCGEHIRIEIVGNPAFCLGVTEWFANNSIGYILRNG
jgi:hypothetical protein